MTLSLAVTAHAQIQVPSAANSTTPAVVKVSTSGDHCFDVIVRDASNAPIAGATVLVGFGCTPDFCDDQVHTGNNVTAITNGAGIAHFCVCATITAHGCNATISAEGVTLAIRPAQSVENTRFTITYSGTINGQPANYTSIQNQNGATLHLVRDDSNMAVAIGRWCRRHPRKDGSGWVHSRPCCKETNSIEELGAGPFHLVTNWTEGASTLTLTQDFTWAMSGDSLMTINDTAVWSGTCPDTPPASTITVDPFTIQWQQIGPGHVRKSYVETYRVDGTPHTISVVEDLTYPGPAVLMRPYVETVSNISVVYNAGTLTEHTEYDEAFPPAAAVVPMVSTWGLIALAVSLPALGVLIVRRRRVGA